MSISEKDTGGVFGSSLPEVSLEAGLNEKEKARLFELFEELAKVALGDHFRTHADFPQFISTYRQWIKSNHQDWLAAERQGQLNANVQDTAPFVMPSELEPMTRQAVEKKLNQHRSWWVKQLKGEADQPSVLTSSDSLLEQKFSSEVTMPSVEAESTEPIVAIERFVMDRVEKPEIIFLEAKAFFQQYIQAVWPLIYPNEELAMTPIDYWEEVFFENDQKSQLELWKKLIGQDKTNAERLFNFLREKVGRIIIQKEIEGDGKKVAEERLGRSLEWWIWYHLNRDDAEINKMVELYEAQLAKKTVDTTEKLKEQQLEQLADVTLGEHTLVNFEEYKERNIELSDQVTIAMGDRIATVHLMRNLSRLNELLPITAARKILLDMQIAFEQFAQMIMEDPEKFDFKAVTLTTHFQTDKLKEWGFDVLEVSDLEKAALADTGTSYFMARNPNADEEEVFARKFERVRKYAISRQKFLEKFGKKTQAPEEAAA